MEAFLLNRSLSKQGFKVYSPFKKRELNEAIIFHEGKLYVSRREESVGEHAQIARKIKTGSLTPADLSAEHLSSISIDNIRQTYYTNELTSDFSEGLFGTASVWNCPKNYYIRFYDSFDVSPEQEYSHQNGSTVKIHSLWFAIPETKELLRPYFFPLNGETTIAEYGSWFNAKDGGLAVGDHNLGLVLLKDVGEWIPCRRVTYNN